MHKVSQIDTQARLVQAMNFEQKITSFYCSMRMGANGQFRAEREWMWMSAGF